MTLQMKIAIYVALTLLSSICVALWVLVLQNRELLRLLNEVICPGNTV